MADFERARLAAQCAARELDEADRCRFYDPVRFATAQQRARTAFDALVAATRHVLSPPERTALAAERAGS